MRARVTFTHVMGRRRVRNEVRVGVAPSTIARQHVRPAFFEGPILTIPMHAFAYPEHRAPRASWYSALAGSGLNAREAKETAAKMMRVIFCLHD